MIKTKTPPRLAEVGKIKIGMLGKEVEAKQSKKKFRLPIKLDHFLVTTTDKGPDGNFMPDKSVMKKLGDTPTEIPIRLLFDDIDMNFFTSYQYYHGRKCVCRGDGETAKRVHKQGTPKEEIRDIQCNFETCEFAKKSKCKVSGILSCSLPDSEYLGGVYRFRTHGWNSVSGILAALQFFKDNTNGVLQGLPLKLKFLKKNTEEHGNVPMVAIVLDKVELLEMREIAMEEARNRERLGVDIKMIEDSAVKSGFMEDTDDPADVEAEWYPDADSDPGTSADDLEHELTGKKEAAEVVEDDPPEPGPEQEPEQKKIDSVI
jgi:hypothetical protein